MYDCAPMMMYYVIDNQCYSTDLMYNEPSKKNFCGIILIYRYFYIIFCEINIIDNKISFEK